eukprot:TRINITY_DN4010_c0_g2_i4.p1 TRINITY_DN4010_c0_g2~~TRINITY_DN4010_c0_g2_i4.p1  ORF type:complete len:1179 (+),score=331.65 TRINITY_DN4010_c0_g2_i4:74-3610(+)
MSAEDGSDKPAGAYHAPAGVEKECVSFVSTEPQVFGDSDLMITPTEPCTSPGFRDEDAVLLSEGSFGPPQTSDQKFRGLRHIDSDHLERLKDIVLTGDDITTLSLHRCAIPDMFALADCVSSAGVKYLDLSFCRLGEDILVQFFHHITQTFTNTALRKLDVSYNLMGLKSVRLFRALGLHQSVIGTSLRSLTVAFNPITAIGMGELLHMFPFLRKLDASYCGILHNQAVDVDRYSPIQNAMSPQSWLACAPGSPVFPHTDKPSRRTYYTTANRDALVALITDNVARHLYLTNLYLEGNGFTPSEVSRIDDIVAGKAPDASPSKGTPEGGKRAGAVEEAAPPGSSGESVAPELKPDEAQEDVAPLAHVEISGDPAANKLLRDIRGDMGYPHLDHWQLSYPVSGRFTQFKQMGGMLSVFLRPRKRMSLLQKPVSFKFQLPWECVKGYDLSVKPSPVTQGVTKWFFYPPELPFSVPPDSPSTVTVKLAGDLLEGLHDGVLADGGRFGQLVLSHGAEWQWSDWSAFQGALRKVIAATLGAADEGQEDAITKGWDSHTTAFLLAPRAVARNMNGRTVLQFAPIPGHMVRPADSTATVGEAVRVTDNIVIEDVVTAYSEMRLRPAENGAADEPAAVFSRHPVMEYSAFLKGGFTITLVLEAGAFFVTDEDAVTAEVRKLVQEVYGLPAEGSSDTVRRESALSVSISFGKRDAQSDWRPKWTNTQRIPRSITFPTLSPKSNMSQYIENHNYPDTHRVLRLTIPKSILLSPAPNVTEHCLLPEQDGCTYQPYSGPLLHPFPSLVVKLKPQLKYRWAVIGAGPSGMNGLGRVLDANRGREDSILWIDERGFKVGRLEGYHDVQSMNPCQDFIQYMNDYEYYSTLDYGDSKNPLLTYESGKRHCRLGFLSEPLLKATRVVRSALTSVTGRVTDMHKVFFNVSDVANPNSTDFVWSLRVGDHDPIWVTHGVVVAIGADHHHENFTFPTPPEVPFTTSLNPGLLRSFIDADQHKRDEAFQKKQKVVAVFGAGPSGVVALHNLALLPEVKNVIHFVRHLTGDFPNILPVRHDGKFMNVTRIVYTAAKAEQYLPQADYFVQCIGWRFPSFPMNGSLEQPTTSSYISPKLYNVGVKHLRGSKKGQLFFISSLRSQSRMAFACTGPGCFTADFPPIPENLIDPNATAKGGYVAA